MYSWKDCVCVVTGGASGIGLEYVKLVCKTCPNAKIAVLDLKSSSELQDVQKHCPSVQYFPCNVADAESFHKACKQAHDTLGAFTIFVNNAGISNGNSILNTPSGKVSPESWKRIVDIDLLGVVYGSGFALEFRNPNSFVLVNISSMAGLIPMPSGPVYAAAKHGVVGLSRSLAAVYAKENVKVHVICPSFTDTALVRKGIKDPAFLKTVTNVMPDLSKQLLRPEQVAQGIQELVEAEQTGKVMRVTLQRGIDYAFKSKM